MHSKLFHLADAGHAGNHQFVVAVTLHSCLAEEQVNLVIISLRAHLALWHLSHGNKVGLWHRKKKKNKTWILTQPLLAPCKKKKHITHHHILPWSQELLNSVRMETGELRIRTGSEPRKFIEVAEYRLFSGITWRQTQTYKFIHILINCSSSTSYLLYNWYSPNMMEAYLWKGSNGHFPLPSSPFFSRVSFPFAYDCTDTHL